MSRREFSSSIKRQALERANGKCEGFDRKAVLTVGKYHYDHDIADALGGEPELWNCKVLCHSCHANKTRMHDVPLIAKTKRIQDRHHGIRPKPKMQSPKRSKAPPQLTASRPLKKRMFIPHTLGAK